MSFYREGIRGILNLFHCNVSQGNENVVHINLRNEPYTYINGHTYVLRKINNPFQNFSDYGSLTVYGHNSM